MGRAGSDYIRCTRAQAGGPELRASSHAACKACAPTRAWYRRAGAWEQALEYAFISCAVWPIVPSNPVPGRGVQGPALLSGSSVKALSKSTVQAPAIVHSTQNC